MKFNGEEYYRAALERMRQAREIHGRRDSYALAMYCAGLAVECMLRAFRWDEDKGFEGRHDLEQLLRASKLIAIHEALLRERRKSEQEIEEIAIVMRGAIGEVSQLWHNNLRYASEASLRAHLRRAGRIQGIKGDVLKKNSSDLLNAAQKILDQGIAVWTSQKKSQKA